MPLALAARERDPALADHRVVPVRQPLDELVRLREPRRLLDLLVGRVGPAEGEVLAHGRREEERVLRDHADLAAQRVERHVAHVGAVDRHAPALDVVEARDQRRERRLPGAGVADQRDRLPGLELEVDVVQHRPRGVVAEGHALEADAARPRRAARPPPGRRRISSGSSITWKIRSPDAVARWPSPIHIPSIRSGKMSIAR